MTGARRIVVVGASIMDLISYVPRLPSPGETLHGSHFQLGYGGKGANQAIMAAKLGSQVSIVTKLGQDDFGEGMMGNFASHGISVDYVYRTDEASTGVAPIVVDADGRNSIVIVTGANARLTVEEVHRARNTIADADLVVCQLEIAPEITEAALRLARESGVRTLLNPAPAVDALSDDLLALVDILCPNENEAERLTGQAAATAAAAIEQAQSLRDRGAGAVVLTLGARGSLVVDHEHAQTIAAESVQVADTTGAGDSFVGSLAHFVAGGADLVSSAICATRIATISVQRRGTQSSFPGNEELPADLRPQSL